jgi:hypothetical protein
MLPYALHCAAGGIVEHVESTRIEIILLVVLLLLPLQVCDLSAALAAAGLPADLSQELLAAGLTLEFSVYVAGG